MWITVQNNAHPHLHLDSSPFNSLPSFESFLLSSLWELVTNHWLLRHFFCAIFQMPTLRLLLSTISVEHYCFNSKKYHCNCKCSSVNDTILYEAWVSHTLWYLHYILLNNQPHTPSPFHLPKDLIIALDNNHHILAVIRTPPITSASPVWVWLSNLV